MECLSTPFAQQCAHAEKLVQQDGQGGGECQGGFEQRAQPGGDSGIQRGGDVQAQTEDDG